MARIAIAGFMHETNTFSPVPTTFESFSHVSEPLSGILFEKEIREFIEKPLNSAFCGFYQQATALGHDVVPLIKIGEAEPSGQLSEELFNHLLGLVLEELAARGPFDGVFLDLHGSLTYYDCQDGEEEILRRVRQLVGDIPIVNSLDMHANINQKSIDYSSAMNGYRTYPHIDIGETGASLRAHHAPPVTGQASEKSVHEPAVSDAGFRPKDQCRAMQKSLRSDR